MSSTTMKCLVALIVISGLPSLGYGARIGAALKERITRHNNAKIRKFEKHVRSLSRKIDIFAAAAKKASSHSTIFRITRGFDAFNGRGDKAGDIHAHVFIPGKHDGDEGVEIASFRNGTHGVARGFSFGDGWTLSITAVLA